MVRQRRRRAVDGRRRNAAATVRWTHACRRATARTACALPMPANARAKSSASRSETTRPIARTVSGALTRALSRLSGSAAPEAASGFVTPRMPSGRGHQQRDAIRRRPSGGADAAAVGRRHVLDARRQPCAVLAVAEDDARPCRRRRCGRDSSRSTAPDRAAAATRSTRTPIHPHLERCWQRRRSCRGRRCR